MSPWEFLGWMAAIVVGVLGLSLAFGLGYIFIRSEISRMDEREGRE
jgi:hypothetical protein